MCIRDSRYLVEAAGGLKCEPGRVVNGGPMMGHAVPSLDYPVLKTTGSVLVFSEARYPRADAVHPLRPVCVPLPDESQPHRVLGRS